MAIRLAPAEGGVAQPSKPERWVGGQGVLLIPARPSSVYYRAYADTLGEVAVLDWALDRVSSVAGSEWDVCVLAPKGEVPRVTEIVVGGGRSARVIAVEDCGLKGLQRLATVTRAPRFVVSDLAGAVLPRRLQAALMHHHVQNGNDVTRLVRTPCPDPPAIVEAELLASLANGTLSLPFALLNRDIGHVLSALEEANALTGSPLRLGRFSAASEADIQGWPYRVRLELPEDVAVLRRALLRASTNSGLPFDPVAEPLPLWARATQEEARRRNVESGRSLREPPGNDEAKEAILYVHNPSAFTGAERVATLLASGLAHGTSSRFDTSAIVGMAGVLSDRLTEACTRVYVANRNLSAPTVANYSYSRRKLRDIEPSLVHAHTVLGLPFRCALSESGIPLVQHVHVVQDRLLEAIEDQITTAGKVIAVSHFVKSKAIRIGIDPASIEVIHNAVVLSPASPEREGKDRARVRARARTALGISDDVALLLLPARFAAYKRHDLAVEALAVIRARGPNAHLAFAGERFPADVSLVRAIKDKVGQFGLDNYVHFMGFNTDMGSLYCASDVLVLPAEGEPFGMVLLEAMTKAVPIVAVDSGGVPEIVEEGRSGLLVGPGDVEGFAAAVTRVLADDELRNKLASGGLARCRADFNLDRQVAEVCVLYERLLDGGPVD